MAFTSFSGNCYSVVSDEAKAADFNDIPLVDLTLPQDELIGRVRDACTRVGFFYISNHGVPQETIDRVFATAQDFFNLEAGEKQQVHFGNVKALCGYEGFQSVYTDETRKRDLNEAFSWRYSPEMDPLQQASRDSPAPAQGAQDDHDFLSSGQNQWPDAAKPELRRDIAEYYGSVLMLSRRLIRLFALALGLSETYFDDMMQRPGSMGKVLHYPPQPLRAADAPLGIGAHTDIECCTILCQGGNVPALQVLNPKGEWILAPPIQGTFVVNIGDMLARWSNDTFRSTIHRVLNLTGQQRYSLPVFIGPSYDTIIKPLETCLAEGAKYEPISAGLYVWKRLAISRLDKEEYERQLVEMERRPIEVVV